MGNGQSHCTQSQEQAHVNEVLEASNPLQKNPTTTTTSSIITSSSTYDDRTASTVLPFSRDVFIVISRHLSGDDLLACSLVCRQLHQMVENEAIWRDRLVKESALWHPDAPSFDVSFFSSRNNQMSNLASLKRLYLHWHHRVHHAPLLFSCHNDGSHASRLVLHDGAYGTCRAQRPMTRGRVHFAEICICFGSHYAGIGIMEHKLPLPEPGRGVWLGPCGAIQWVTGSGIWAKTHHQFSVAEKYESGDRVGVLVDLRPKHGLVYWSLNGVFLSRPYVLETTTLEQDLSFCMCLGNGSIEITRAYLPDKLPDGFERPQNE